jgi:glutamyl-tRNA synthetase
VIEERLRALVEEKGVKPKEIFQPIRVALTGKTVSPGIFESLWALGREESLSRVEKALRKAESEAA